MSEPVTHGQLNGMLDAVYEKMTLYIDKKFVEHERVEMLIKESTDRRIDTREEDIEKINGVLEDNGKPGLKTLVDRMWQDHGSTIWWLRIVGASVIGKILFDIFTK